MKIWLIDDEEEIGSTNLEKLKQAFPKATITHFTDMFDAMESGGRADYIIIDVSSVCPFMLDIYKAYSPIAALINRYPGASIIITSAVGKPALKELKERVEEAVPNTLLYVADWKSTGPIESCVDIINNERE